MPDEVPEADLLARLAAGDDAALGPLYARYRDRLRKMVGVRLDRRLNGRVAPSDVLQEAYLDALKRFPHYFAKPDQSFFGWLRLVVGQRLADVHREHLDAKMRDARNEVPLASPDSSAGLAGLLAGRLTSPSGVAAKRETAAALEAALDSLDPTDREVLVLRHFEELSNADTAAALGLLPAAASKRYVRALGRLRAALEEAG